MALSMRVLNTTPGFQDSSNPHESSRTSSDPGVKAGADVAVSNFGTMSGATDFG